MSDDELVRIEAAAAAAGLSVPSYLVATAMRPPPARGLGVAQRRAVASEIRGVMRVLRRARENLYRLGRIGQERGALPREIPAAAEAMQRYVEHGEGVVAALDPRRSGRNGGAR